MISDMTHRGSTTSAPADKPTEPPRSDRTTRFNRRRALRLGMPLATVALVAFFAAISPDFRGAQNAQDVVRQMAALAIVAVGEAFVILGGGLDLSVGSTIGLTSVVAALASLKLGWVGAMPVALLAGATIGAVNGLLVTWTGVSSFIVTLGTLSVVKGLALTLAGGSAIYNLPGDVSSIGFGSWGPIPLPGVIALAAMVLGYAVLRITRFGRHIYAMGGNSEAARLSGVPLELDQFLVFVISGVLAAVAGIVLTSRVSSGQPELGSGMELNAVAAVVLGGVSLFGGQGSMAGVFFGVLFISVLSNGLIILGVQSYTQYIVIGAALVCAVAVDRLLMERSKQT